MPIQQDESQFIIRIKVGGVTARVDLSNPAFEKQVLAAAGRFNSLRRTKVGGGKSAKPAICADCNQAFPSVSAFIKHKCLVAFPSIDPKLTY